MKIRSMMMASCALVLIGTTAMADCASDLAQLKASADQGVSKDGSLAPLEAPDAAAEGAVAGTGQDAAASPTATDDADDAVYDNPSDTGQADETADAAKAGHEGIAKDGSLAPLETDPSDTPVATSAQDAQAQHKGGATAAEVATDSAAPAQMDGSGETDRKSVV